MNRRIAGYENTNLKIDALCGFINISTDLITITASFKKI